MSTLISLEKNIEIKEEDKLDIDWNLVPSYSVPQLLPNGISFAVNVKNHEIDPVTNHAKWIRLLRQYDMATDTFTQRIDYLVNPDHDLFKPHDVDESIPVGDSPMEGESIEAGFAGTETMDSL